MAPKIIQPVGGMASHIQVLEESYTGEAAEFAGPGRLRVWSYGVSSGLINSEPLPATTL